MASFPLSDALIQHIRSALTLFGPVPIGAESELRRAAVGIVIVPPDDGSGEACFLLTTRPTTMRAHGGQFALPGGKIDPGETQIETTIRECEEELGLELAADDVLGVLDDYPTHSGFAITPVVLYADREHLIVPNRDEIDKVYRVPLNEIVRTDSFEFVESENADRPLVRLNVVGTQVHAPTAAMVYQFAELLQGRRTSVAHLEQPEFARR